MLPYASVFKRSSSSLQSMVQTSTQRIEKVSLIDTWNFQALVPSQDIVPKSWLGDNPMHDAVRLGRYRIVKSLILHGANLRVQNQAKKSPIDMVQLWYKDTKKENTIEARKKNSVAAKMTDLLQADPQQA